MADVRKRGVTVHSAERNLIRRVTEVCDKESSDKSLALPIEKATECAAHYCQVSKRTILRVRKAGKLTPDEKLDMPGKKRKRADHHKVQIDSFDRRVIVNTIKDFYATKKVVPTCKKLLPVLKEKINFRWSEWTLRRVLKDMGFKWRKCGSKRKLLIERPDIVNWRFKYLREIRKIRDQKKKIFYLDETWIESNLTFQKCWQSDAVDGVLPEINASNRVIVVDIGSEEGLLQGGRLIYKANCTKGDYHGQMNFANFGKWIRERVLPNLPPDLLLLLTMHPIMENRRTKSCTKKVMIEWLSRHGEHYDEKTTRKAELFEAVERLKPPTKVFKIDQLLKQQGHTVLRLPPYMCDLNAVEFVWAKVKQHVRSRNSTGNMSLGALIDLATEALNSVTPELWKKYCDHVRQTEEDYWTTDGIIEDAVDELIIRLGNDDPDDSDSSSTDDLESDSPHDTDEELAQPLDND